MLDLLPGVHVWFATLWISLVVVPVWWWGALASAIAVQRAGSGAKLAAIVTGTVLAGAALLVAWNFIWFMM